MTNTRVAELINQNNFVSILKNELYVLIDEELAKDTEMDCDLIDELVNAIEALEQCEDENPAVVLPLIFADGTLLSKRIRNKVNGKKTLMRITALAAAFAMILSGANQIPATEGIGDFDNNFLAKSNLSKNSEKYWICRTLSRIAFSCID
mgnify:CR=1 FL=1